MASMKKKRYREPQPTTYPFVGAVGMKMYSWSGSADPKVKQLSVDLFDPIRESWKQLESRGDTPAAYKGGATATVMNDMYTYGGQGKSEYNGLHKLETATMKWSFIDASATGGIPPSPKSNAKMVALDGNRLALLGGYTPKTVKKVSNPFQKKGFGNPFQKVVIGGLVDEFHIFNIDKAEWTSPACYGDIPPPCSNFAFIPIDPKRAVMFGGYSKSMNRSNELYIIHWDSLVWKKIGKSGIWPKGRKALNGCCLNYGQPDPIILIVGGQDDNEVRLKDMWLFNINQLRWTPLPDLPHPPRSGHALVPFTLSDNLVEVTLFAGESASGKKLSHTCIIRFEQEGGGWNLTNIIEPADVGRPIERVQEKMESLGLLPSTAQSSVTSNELGGQPIGGGEKSATESKESSATESRKLERQETSCEGEGGLGHLSVRSKRSYIIELNELEFGRQLGEGAFGTVYAGKWKTHHNIEVAIKKCFNKPFDAEILSVLPRHPNVVFFYATSSSEDATYIVTELVTNGSLYDYIHADKKDFDNIQAISWAKQIGYGMEHLHGHNLVHRDLKSGNVLISEDMEMKVCDFGTARAVVDKCEQSTVRGTYRWMAPEIMKEDDAVIDKNCDVYSFGCVLYELFERKLPYHKEKNSVFLAMKVLDGLRPEFGEDSSIPQFLKNLTEACWEDEPQLRPAFEDCITALRMKSYQR